MFPDEGVLNILAYILASGDIDLKYRLFKTNITIDANTVLADFTECDFDGYAPLDSVTEPAVTVNGSHEANSIGDLLTWTCTATMTPPQQAWGMYVTFTDLGTHDALLMAWTFDAPISIAFSGDQVKKKVNWYAKDFAP